MRLISVSLKNLRCYQEECTIKIDDLTTLIGKNDIGKSTILEALEIFFNNETIKIETNDANVHNKNKKIIITCEFDNLPTNIVIDTNASTTLAEEYLLTTQGTLKIQKIFDCDKQKPTCDVFILANHPTAEKINNLLELKEKELQSLIKELQLDTSLKGNPGMRHAIWQSSSNLNLAEVSICVNKSKEDCKRIWEQIENYLPIFAFFQSDRNSRDSDEEVQNPMKSAIVTAISEVQDEINKIQIKVKEKVIEIARNTLSALQTIDYSLANELIPEFSLPTSAKWSGLFSINLKTDEGIPLNKRGSGIRRLILISFFKAEAERRLKTSNKRNIIYAIEEPDTAQHPNNQLILADSFKTLSAEPNCQIILTTHCPGFASELPTDSIRFISRNEKNNPTIESGVDVFGKVADALGIIPDSRVKALVCMEGPTDIQAIKCLSHALHKDDSSIPDLSTDERIGFIVLGGSSLKHWVNHQYLKGLKLPEIHIYDRDVSKYEEIISQVNSREDASWGVRTNKLEIENYLHPTVVEQAFDINIEIADDYSSEKETVAKAFAKALSVKANYDGVMSENKAKIRLADKAFPLMTASLIKERDPNGEIISWLRKIKELLDKPVRMKP